jgi:hypothetical protein
MKINRILFLISSVLFVSCFNHSDITNKTITKTNATTCRIAFYNTENLFDTVDDKHINDNDFLPTGKLNWTTDRYNLKLQHMRAVLDGLNKGRSLALIGLAEVENEDVLKDLLIDTTYQFIHYNSSDTRGIDVCLIFNPIFFTPITSYLSYFDKVDDPELFLREVLVVKGVLWNDTIHVLVNHWPSRRAGEEASAHKRIAAAMLAQEIVDSIYMKNPLSNIIVMGDFNDQPSDESMAVMLNTTFKKDRTTGLVNPFKAIQESGNGTCRYKRDWFLFDQILISNSLMNKKGAEFIEAQIYNPEWLYYKEDSNSGPFRTYLGNKYFGGYSDHFPVYLDLKK